MSLGLSAAFVAYYYDLYNVNRKYHWDFSPDAKASRGYNIFFSLLFTATFVFWLPFIF